MPRKVFVAGEVLTAADVNTNLMDQAVMVFADSGARGSAIGSPSEGMVSYLEDSDSIEVYGGTATGWVHTASAGTPSYRYVDTVYFTSNGTFSKGDYPWLRAIRVKMVGGGGGGGGTSSAERQGSQGGGGGGYSEAFITDIAGLSASESVTVGSGGSGGSTSPALGSGGGTSSAFAVSATGGSGGQSGAGGATGTQGLGGIGSGGDLNIGGGPAGAGSRNNLAGGGNQIAGQGGNSVLGGGGPAQGPTTDKVGIDGFQYGGGGGGALSNIGSGQSGGDGADGIVIVELYA